MAYFVKISKIIKNTKKNCLYWNNYDVQYYMIILFKK